MTLDASSTTEHRWIELISDPALLCDETGTILRANRPARVFFSVEYSQYKGVPVLWIIPAASRDQFLLDWDRKSRSIGVSEPERSPMWVEDSQKRSIPTWMKIEQVNSFGQPQFVVVFRDAPGLCETNLTEHLSSVRHDIRNPLSGIKVFTDVLLLNRSGNLDQSQIDHLTAIQNEAGNLAALIEAIDVPGVLSRE